MIVDNQQATIYWSNQMKNFKNSDLAQLLDKPNTKVRRWAKEFLPPDPKATIQSGYARQHTLRDAFIIYLGGFLVSDLHYIAYAARQILTDLNGWLEKRGIYPDLKYNENIDGIPIKSWKIDIMPRIPSGFHYNAIGIVERKVERHKKRNVKIRKYIEEPIIPEGYGKGFQYDDANVRVLRISWLVEIFKSKIEGKKIDRIEEWFEYRLD